MDWMLVLLIAIFIFSVIVIAWAIVIIVVWSEIFKTLRPQARHFNGKITK